MSILMPDRHGKWDATDDSRLSLDASDVTLRGFLRDTHGALIIGCGNPTFSQDFYNEGDGANANFGIIELFGNLASTSPGYVALQFRSYGRASGQNPSRFQFQFRPNGGSQATLTAYSAEVTHDNCAYVVVERNGDDYAVHLYDQEGTKTAGTPVTHDASSLGATLRNTAYTVYLGGMEATFPITTFPQWPVQLENFILVEQATSIVSLDTKIQNVIAGGSAVSEFGITNVKMWRTLADLGSTSLAAEATATTDIYPAFVNPATSRAVVGSPIGGADPTTAANLDESKYNFVGVQAGSSTETISIGGECVGSVTNVEGRLLNLSDLSEAQTWQTLDASPGATWSGSFTGVSPGEYCIELRPSNVPANVYAGRNPWVVGYVMAIMGQSQNEIAFNSIGGRAAGFTLPAAPTNAAAYVVNVVENSTYGFKPSVLRIDGDEDYSDALLYAQIEWERYNPGVPVIWARMFKEGSGVDNWLDDDIVAGSYRYFGDGASYGTGIATDTRLALGTDKINIILSWGTSDLTNSDYSNRLNGWVFDEGTGFTGASFKHMTDLFNSGFGIAQTPLTRAITTVTDNFSADPVEDDYASSASFRENQQAIVEAWISGKSNRVLIGPSVNDMTILAAGGPHQPGTAEGEAPYLAGSPRLGARWGLAAGWLVEGSDYTIPTLGSANFTSAAKTAFSIPVDSGSFGALKNADATSDVSGFEISTDNGTTWNRKGFTAAYSGSDVTLTKDSGDWTAVATDELLWRYHKGGPYSYGTSFVTEMRADIDKALYATDAAEESRGIPIEQKTNESGLGGFPVGAFVSPPLVPGVPSVVSNSAIADHTLITTPAAMADAGGTGGHSNGIACNIVLSDEGLPSGDYLQFNGADISGQIAIDVTAGTQFEFLLKANNTGSAQDYLGGSTTSALITHSAANTLDYSGVSSVAVDGVTYASGSLTLADGQQYKITGEFDNAETLTHIGSSSASGNYASGVVGYLSIDGGTYEYLTADSVQDLGSGQGLARNTGNVAEYGANVVDDDAWSEPAGVVNDGGVIDFINLNSQFITQSYSWDAGAVYHVTVDITITAGGAFRLPYDGDVSNIFAVSSSGSYSHVFVSSGGGLLFMGYPGSATGQIRNIVVRKTSSALINNYDPITDLTAIANDSREYPLNVNAAAQPNTLNPGTNDATIVNYDSSMKQ